MFANIDYFAINKKLLKIATLWHTKGESKIYLAYSVFAFVYCVVYCAPSEFASLWESWEDLNEFSMNFGIALTHGIAVWKITNFYNRRKQLLTIMDTLQSDEFDYEPSGDFQPELIKERATNINIKLSKTFMSLCLSIPVSSYLVMIFNFIFRRHVLYHEKKNGEIIFCHDLPFYNWIPFDRTASDVSCIIAVLFQSYPFIYLTIMIASVDLMYMALMNMITCHLVLLQGAFKTTRARSLAIVGEDAKNHFYDTGKLETEMSKQMKKSLRHLQQTQDICNQMEDIYSMQNLGQVLVSLFALCTCLYLLSTVPVKSRVFFVQVLYIAAVYYQLALYCWFGNELTLAGEEVPQFLYEGDWYSSSKSFKQSMLLTIQRMQRPMVLTVGKFTPLTLNTFVTIVRGSYSLYALLKNRN